MSSVDREKYSTIKKTISLWGIIPFTPNGIKPINSPILI